MQLRHSSVRFSSKWDVLGPFQIGTREAIWGADPLEFYGGFSSLAPEANALYKSALGPQGLAQWLKCIAIHRTDEFLLDSIELNPEFTNVDWTILQETYGWAALQYQAWARGTIRVEGTEVQHLALYTPHVIEFNIDAVRYFGGDFYGFRRAPSILHLAPGDHTIEIRLLYDIRSMGASKVPAAQVRLELSDAQHPAMLLSKHMVLPDVIDGKLASSLGSVPLTNTGEDQFSVHSITSSSSSIEIRLLSNNQTIEGGQTRPVAFAMTLLEADTKETKIILELTLRQKNGNWYQIRSNAYDFNVKSIREPHKFTYLHPGGIVSYAMLRPPGSNAELRNRDPETLADYPVLVFLHGAGAEVDNSTMTHCLDAISDLPVWTIFPSGVTTWSGDDWHQWGWADVETSVAEIPTWIKSSGWHDSSVNTSRWIVAGHSNGGQGTWYALTHKPDNIIAAVAVSGYLSIQKYVPYIFWNEAEPNLMSIIHSSMTSYRHELLIPNSLGIPIMQQHGDNDGNVPVIHSRRMRQLIFEQRWKSEYNEIQGAGHWFDGVMTTAPLQDFMKQHLISNSNMSKMNFANNKFSLICANPGEFGPKNGYQIHQVFNPAQLGRLTVSSNSEEIELQTSNVRKFSLVLSYAKHRMISIDKQILALPENPNKCFFLRSSATTKWRFVEPVDSFTLSERNGHQLGSINSILNGIGPFAIVAETTASRAVALQISQSLFQYYGADCEILSDYTGTSQPGRNVIRLYTASQVTISAQHKFPISIDAATVKITDSSGSITVYEAKEDGLGCIFLQPFPNNALELTLWGSNQFALQAASRLAPTLTGVGQPDFVVLTESILREGLGGVLAMGHFDSLWKVSKSSFLS